MSLDFYDVPIQDVLRALSIQNGVNIVKASDVSGNVTIHLNSLNFEESLSYLLESIGATFTKKNGLYYVSNKPKISSMEKQNKKFHLTVKDGLINLLAHEASLPDIIQEISNQTDINIAFSANLRGRVSAKMENVDLFKGMEAILKDNRYTLKKDKHIYSIERASRPQKFKISYMNDLLSIEAYEAPVRAVLQEISLQTGTSIVCSSYVKGNVNAVVKNESIETIIRLILTGSGFQYRKYRDVYVIGNGDDLQGHSRFFIESSLYNLKHLRAEEVIKKLPPSIPSSNLQFFEEQNAISIAGSPSLVKEVEAFLKEIDKPVPQIKIDVLIIEYDLSANKTHGLNLRDIQGSFGNEHSRLDLSPSIPNTLNLTYDVAKSLTRAFKLNLQSLIQNNKAKVTANPSIWTLNGKEATIDVLTEDRFRELRYNETSSRLEPVGTPRTIESGVKLKIRPWITGSDQINLEIEPEVSSATGSLSSDNLPQTTKRKAKTVLKIQNGKTIVIGGLIQTLEKENQSRIPFLSKVPLIKDILQNKGITKHRTELVFYITPTISNDNEIQTPNKNSKAPLFSQKKHPYSATKTLTSPSFSRAFYGAPQKKIANVPSHQSYSQNSQHVTPHQAYSQNSQHVTSHQAYSQKSQHASFPTPNRGKVSPLSPTPSQESFFQQDHFSLSAPQNPHHQLPVPRHLNTICDSGHSQFQRTAPSQVFQSQNTFRPSWKTQAPRQAFHNRTPNDIYSPRNNHQSQNFHTHNNIDLSRHPHSSQNFHNQSPFISSGQSQPTKPSYPMSYNQKQHTDSPFGPLIKKDPSTHVTVVRRVGHPKFFTKKTDSTFSKQVDQLGWHQTLNTEETGFQLKHSRKFSEWDKEVEKILHQDRLL
ncbi:hypothetical protein AB834_07170 [PVC group bacterium (ex Bugula neritina AB1)]|nr:hypothetical protein AB834_07170 [PVC group bacterium (ex Bugula neritina AB1)]